MVRSNLLRAVFIALLVVLAIPGVALAAKPIAAFHDHFTDSFSGNVCGIDVDIKVVVTDNFYLYADRQLQGHELGEADLHESGEWQVGRAFVRRERSRARRSSTKWPARSRSPRPTKGLPEKIQTARGAVLTRDAGIITIADTFDLVTGDFLGEDGSP